MVMPAASGVLWAHPLRPCMVDERVGLGCNAFSAALLAAVSTRAAPSQLSRPLVQQHYFGCFSMLYAVVSF